MKTASSATRLRQDAEAVVAPADGYRGGVGRHHAVRRVHREERAALQDEERLRTTPLRRCPLHPEHPRHTPPLPGQLPPWREIISSFVQYKPLGL